MKVSALIPTYNRRTYVSRAIESILSQTVLVDEVIVVDDGSTDDTAKHLDLQFGSRVRIVRQTNQGVSSARRRAVQEARNEWVAFLDSDDEWTPNRNQLFTEAINTLPAEVAWVFGDVGLVQDQGESETLFGKFGLRLNESPHVFEDAMTVQHPFQFGLLQGSLIRKEPLLEIHAFCEGLKHSEDFLTGVQIACRYKFAAIQSIVTRMHRTSDLKSSSLDLAGRKSSDYCRARVMAFSSILDSGRKKGSWGSLHAEAVRGLCKVLAEEGKSVRRLSFDQFRYCVDAKSVAFECAVMLGRPGMRTWTTLAKALRHLRGQEELSHSALGWDS